MTTLNSTASPGDPRAGLVDTIRARRASIETYVRASRPASTRLSTMTIISSACAAALTAGPALGGSSFAETVQEGLFLERSQTVWRVLCLGALVVSVTAAVSAHLEKASDLRSRIGAAEAAGAMLDGLRARLEYGGLAVEEAAQEYRDILAGIPFVPEGQDPRAGLGAPRSAGAVTASARGESRLSGLLTVVVLAMVLLITTAVGLTRGLVGAGAADGGSTAGPTASVSPGPSSVPTPTPSPPPETGQGVFGGPTADGSASLAIVTGAGQAAAYVCDGRQFEAWLQGSVVDGRLELTGQNGASLTGTVGKGAISGEFRSADLSTPFVAVVAAEPAGVYEANIEVNGADARIGWAVLPDGSQVGIVNIEGARGAAPPLDVDDRTFTLNGVEHRATRLEP